MSDDKKGILIFNKDEHERNTLLRLLKTTGNTVFASQDGLEALHIIQKENIGLILAGGSLPWMDREEFKTVVGKIRPGVDTIFTSSFSDEGRAFTVDMGDFLGIVGNSLRTEGMRARELADLKHFSFAIADRLLQIFAVNDKYFFNNDHLVSELSGRIAARMGLDNDLVDAVKMSALLRDLGRVVIHQQILEENKRLNQTELTPIKAHPIHTTQILRQIRFPWNLDSIISQHHEHYDGSGYPMGLKGREISIGARIISVVDAYYAMSTDRPYRKALQKESVIKEIKKNAGSQFDPEVVEVFLGLVGEDTSDTALRKSILIFERDQNTAAMVKLSTAVEGFSVIHSTSSIDAISRIRHRDPQIIIADVEALEPETFQRFYQTVLQISSGRGKVLLIVPDRSVLERFGNDVEYIVKPLNIEQITAKIRSILYEQLAPSAPDEVKGLAGNIEDFNLTDIIQILSIGLKTAKVEIIKDEEKGLMYLNRGKIVHASAGGVKGPDAFFQLIKWDHGKFFIKHGQTTNDLNITLDTMHLLIEACTIMDEKNGKVHHKQAG